MQSGVSVADIQIVPKLPTNLWELPAHRDPRSPLGNVNPLADDSVNPLVYQGAKPRHISDRKKEIAAEIAARDEAIRKEAFS